MEKKKKGIRVRRELSRINPDAAGIDIGATFHVVAVPPDRAEECVRTFRSFTGDLHALAAWLKEARIKTVAMESTGVYWIPTYEVLEASGFEVLLVNARHVKNVPGRKTDVNDAQWLQQLHEFGLLRGSFRPPEQYVQLRAYLRHRERLIESEVSHVQHMHKALTQMNIQLHHVIADVTGTTGLKIIRAIVVGERDPKVLAEFRDGRCKATKETIEAALVGNYKPEHIFALRQALELHDFYQQKIEECDAQIESVLAEVNASRPLPEKPLPKRRHDPSRNEPAFDIRGSLHHHLGADLTQIHGLGPYTVLRIIAECGTDMTRWPTPKHFTSWLCLAPNNRVSGGRLLSSRTRKSANRVSTLLRLVVSNLGKTSTALGANYRRLAVRIGKAKAMTAIARKLAELIYRALRYGLDYRDPGADHYEQRYRERVIRNLRRRAKQMGYSLAPTEPIPGGVS